MTKIPKNHPQKKILSSFSFTHLKNIHKVAKIFPQKEEEK
jgi:hypothetical protein